VEVRYQNSKLKRICEDQKSATQRFGAPAARNLLKRLNELRLANDLSEISHRPPARRHKLQGHQHPTYAVTISGGIRLVFRAETSSQSEEREDSIEEYLVRAITVTFLGDYHD
jgi:proteic killer suppression protein